MHATRSVLATFCVALSASVSVLAGTSFTEVTPAGGSWVTNGDEDFWITSVAPADVDGDGDLDPAALGFHVVYFGDVTHRLVLFENDGAGADGRWSFTEEDVPLGSLLAGASDLAWGDYDNDGDPDLVVASDGTMELYRNEKINPLGGCLPILVQIPVFIALYWVLLASVEMRNAPWILWVRDLATPDAWFILPLLMMATMWIQYKLNPTPPDPVQAKVMMFMPLIFGVMFFFFPAGLVLYWLTNNILSIAQQWYVTKQIAKAKKPG